MNDRKRTCRYDKKSESAGRVGDIKYASSQSKSIVDPLRLVASPLPPPPPPAHDTYTRTYVPIRETYRGGSSSGDGGLAHRIKVLDRFIKNMAIDRQKKRKKC